MAYSNEIWSRAQTVLPGGVNSPVRAFRGVGGDPLFFQRGKGPYLFDLNEKKYVDYVLAWGPLILGHAHPKLIMAIENAVRKGLGFGAPHPLEVHMGEKLCRILPTLEQVRMVTSGTEATQSAIRLARGFTQRNKILKFEGCYHGHADTLLVKAGSGGLTFGVPDSHGVPKETAQHTLTVPYNDLEQTLATFEAVGEDLAAVIVEPIAANMNCILPKPGFLQGLRTLCDRYGTVLIFDEIITGFRVGLQGAQGLYTIKPDITCLGKIIGGGLPLAAFGGRRDIMSHLSPLGKVYQAGTLSGNPIALTAGLATLEELESPEVYASLTKNTAFLCKELATLAKAYGIPLQTRCIGGIFGLFFTENTKLDCYADVMKCNSDNFKQFFHGMLKEGVYLAPSAFEVGMMSLSHTEDVLNYTLEAATRVFKSWKRIPTTQTAQTIQTAQTP